MVLVGGVCWIVRIMTLATVIGVALWMRVEPPEPFMRNIPATAEAKGPEG